jgi:hypothetical protein
MMPMNVFDCPNPSSRTMDMGFTQPLREMSTRNLPWYKAQPFNNLAAVCELIV